MIVPHLGDVTVDPDVEDWLCSAPVFVPLLQREVKFVLSDYENDENPTEFDDAIGAFLALQPEVLHSVDVEIYSYYNDTVKSVDADDMPSIDSATDVWNHIELHDNVSLSRRNYGDRKVYVTVEMECDWEPEHGLVMIFKEGKRVTKLGPFDGHLTNSDAFGDPSLEDVVYHLPF
jgi:hypothetical protein